MSQPFLGTALAYVLSYVWSRRNPFMRMNFLGLFIFPAPYLAWVLLAFTFVLNGYFPTHDLLGIAVGHIYYFAEDVWYRERRGMRWFKTPDWLYGFYVTLTI